MIPAAIHPQWMPPTTIMAAPMPKIKIAPEKWGSITVSRHIRMRMTTWYRKPSRSVFIFSRFLEMDWAKKTISPTFATSDGWNCMVPMPGMPSQRVAPLWLMPSSLPFSLGPGRITRTSRMTEM